MEKGTGRVLSKYTATAEAEQLVTVGSSAKVNVELISPRRAALIAHVYRVWGDEHFFSAVKPGQELRIPSDVGEQWVVR